MEWEQQINHQYNSIVTIKVLPRCLCRSLCFHYLCNNININSSIIIMNSVMHNKHQ